jgi:hypothetical protein
MQVVTIPFDYEERSPSEQARVVPICIKSTDEEDNPIDWGWFEAASCVQDPLRALAKSVLNDIWRASEITEAAIHNLWRKHGHRLGREPSRRVYAAAKWEARDRKAGSWQTRRRVLRAFDDLEEVVRKRVLVDPSNYGHVYDNELYFKELGEQLEAEGLDDVSEMLKLIRTGCTWDEIGRRLGKEPDTARIRFRRWTTKIFSRAGMQSPSKSL